MSDEKIDMLIEKIDKLTEVVKASVEVNEELRGIIEKSFKEIKKEDTPEPEPPVDMKTDDEANKEITEAGKRGQEEKDDNDGTAVETGNTDEHEEVTEEIVKASTPIPPGDAVVNKEDPIMKFLKGEMDIAELDKVFG